MGLACGRSQAGTTGERHKDLGYPRISRDKRQTTCRERGRRKKKERAEVKQLLTKVFWKSRGCLSRPCVPLQPRIHLRYACTVMQPENYIHSPHVADGVKLQTRGRRIKCNTRTITSRRDTAWYTEAIWGRTWARQWAWPTCAGTSYAHQIQFIQPLCDLHSKNAHIYFVFTLKKLDELSVEIPSNNYVCVI